MLNNQNQMTLWQLHLFMMGHQSPSEVDVFFATARMCSHETDTACAQIESVMPPDTKVPSHPVALH